MAQKLKSPMQIEPGYHSDALGAAIWMLKQGYLEIDEKGYIWRTHIIGGGRWVTCLRRRAEHIPGGERGNRYYRLNLQVNGRVRSVQAHIVVFCWHHKRPVTPGLQINHKDTRYRHNWPDNLEEVTQSKNIRHSYATGKRPHPWSKATKWRGRQRLTKDDLKAICLAKPDGVDSGHVAIKLAVKYKRSVGYIRNIWYLKAEAILGSKA